MVAQADGSTATKGTVQWNLFGTLHAFACLPTAGSV